MLLYVGFLFIKYLLKKEVKIGILVISALALLIWGFNYLKSVDIFKSQKTIFAVYNQVNGLQPSNSVFIKGIKVGKVKEIYLDPNNSSRVIVKLTVASKFSIPKNSIALIESDLLGTRSINLKFGDSKVFINSNDTLNSGTQQSIKDEVNQQIIPLKIKAENLLISMDSVMNVIQFVLNEKTEINLIKSFESLKNVIRNFESITYNLDTLVGSQRNRLSNIIGNVESISQNLKNNNQKLSNIINNFSNISDSLAKANISKTINKANETLTQTSEIMTKINKGEGTMGMLINNDSLYKNLNTSTKQLNLMLEDIRLHPKRYLSLFGKDNKKNAYKPPTKEEK